MGRKYANPPITEVACEIEFTDDTEWDSAIPGLIYAKAQERFPTREQRVKNLISISSTKKKSLEGKPEIKRKEFTVFLNQDETTFIQVGTRNLSINQLKPYTSWNDFKQNLKYIFDLSQSVIKFDKIKRISLNYVNIITIAISGGTLKLENYFELRPFLGKNLPEDHANFIIGCTFPFSERRDVCKVRLLDIVPQSENAITFMLDIDYFLAIPQSISAHEVLEWAEMAHKEIEKIFEGCISESLKESFNEARQ